MTSITPVKIGNHGKISEVRETAHIPAINMVDVIELCLTIYVMFKLTNLRRRHIVFKPLQNPFPF